MIKAFDGLNLNGGKVIVAYEPVWAIGTNDPCPSADADDAHGWIKMELTDFFGDEEIPILYGGSVTAENVVSYVARDMIDGVLIGGASAKFETYMAIINAARKA